ncbi:hypothetical protein ACFFRR_001318 [Megaselia abdita]
MLKTFSKNNEVNSKDIKSQNYSSVTAAQNRKFSKISKICYSKKLLRSSKKRRTLNKNQLPSSPSLNYKTQIICQLPLERLSNLWNLLKVNKQEIQEGIRNSYVLNNAQFFEKLKDRNSTMQIFCLFCDKKFSTKALLAKHTERVHTIVSQRRSSGRNSQSFINSTCTFCTKSKKTPNAVAQVPAQIQGSSNDLNNLFLHFIDKHPDKYFSCKHCIVRFNDASLLNDHCKQHHQSKPEDFKFVQPISEDAIVQNVQTRRQRRLSIECKAILDEATVSPRRSTSKTRKYKNDSPSGTPVKLRSKVGRFCPSLNDAELSNSMVAETNYTRSRSEVLSCTFDINFYDTIAANVKQNLQLHVDGKLSEGKSTFINPIQTIRSTLVRSPVRSNADGEIHKATSLSIVTAFPTLLTADQYNGCDSMSSKKRSHTKNSWKWKWDSVKKYKYVNEGGKIVKKVKQGNQGLRDLSKLDMWTQLTMRTKFEKQLCLEGETEEKRRQIDELNLILNQRRLPDISLEQREQSFIKLERTEFNEVDGVEETQRQYSEDELDFPFKLNLNRIDKREARRAVILSGEWARPRFYVCFGCGEKFEKIKSLEEHKFHKHPYVASTHYEMVGRELLQGNLYKNFFIPLKALIMLRENGLNTTLKTDCTQRHDHDESMDSVHSVIPIEGTASDDSDSKTTALTVHSNVTRSTDELDNINYLMEQQEHRSAGNSTTENSLECSKCNKLCQGSLELYKHILDCSGDYAWILAKRKKYRYIGTSRRRKLNKNLNSGRKKKDPSTESGTKMERRDNEDNRSVTQSPKPGKIINSAQKNKQTDADTIQRMLQNLPPKRVCRQILPQLNQKQKNKKTEDKSSELTKVTSDNYSSSKGVLPEEPKETNPTPLVVIEIKKSTKVKIVEKVVEDSVNSGTDAISADKNKTVKPLKTIRKGNQKLTKEVSEDKSVDIEPQINENKEDESKKKLRSSPRNQSNVVSPEENNTSPVSPQKRRPKKISDCIAKLQEKLGLPFFGTPVVDVPALNEGTNETVESSTTETLNIGIKPIENIDTPIKTPKRKSLTRKIVKTESLPPLSKKTEQQTSITSIKSIQIQTVHPTIQNQSTQPYTQKPIAHVEAIRPKHFSGTSLSSRRPSILQPTLVPPPPPPPIIRPTTVTLTCDLEDTPLDLSRKPVFENGALDLSKASKISSSDVKTHSIAEILKKQVITDAQPKRRRNKKELDSVSPIPKPPQPLPIVRELKNKLPNVSITSKCVLNIPQNPTFDKCLEPLKKPIIENSELVIPNFKGCVDIIKIPAPKPPVINTEKPSVTIKAIPPPAISKTTISEKLQEKGFIGAFESFIEKKAADNHSSQPHLPVPKDIEIMVKMKPRKQPAKSKDEAKKAPIENLINNDENKSPLNKRRSNRFKVDTKITDLEKNTEQNKPFEKEILSDEDVPLSVTKASLTAENSNFGVNIQSIILDPDKPIDPDLTAEHNLKDKKEVICKHNLCTDKNDVGPDKTNTETFKKDVGSGKNYDDKKSKQIEKDVINKKKARKIKEILPKKSSTKKQFKTEQIEDLNTKPPIIEIEAEKSEDSIKKDEGSIEVRAQCVLVEERNASKSIESEQNLCEAIQSNNIEDKAKEESNILIQNINSSDDKKSSVENNEKVNTSNQVKKKRKRRKNELAAIVADQLLESFKEVDKSRIDDLKMLENLAYEKSEDLLLTGMRLTPTTKRKQQVETVVTISQKKASGRKKAQKEKVPEIVRTLQPVEESVITVDKTFGNGKTFESFRSIGESNKNKSEKQEVLALFKSTLPNHRVDIKRKKKVASSSLNLDDEDDEKCFKNSSNFEKKQKKKKRSVSDTKRDLLKITELISKLSSLSICIGKNKSKKDNKDHSLKLSSMFKVIKDRDPKNVLLKPSSFHSHKNDTALPVEEEKVISRDPRINKSIRSQKQMRSSQRLSRRNSHCAPSTVVEQVPSVNVSANDEYQEDCFLAEITKKVNDQIMSEDKDFNDTNDGFELVKTMMDGDTRMSACSAPPGPGEENTNTDIMDMDLDDNMSVYSTFSTKSVGSRRRRRKSILFSRKPKKSRNLEDLDDRKFECFLCNKLFSTLSSLKSHNKTLTHVQNLSQQEFLSSQKEPKSKSLSPPPKLVQKSTIKSKVTVVVRETPADSINLPPNSVFNRPNAESLPSPDQNYEPTRLKLNPDEKLFYECCNILKGSETPRVERTYPIANTTYTNDIPPPQQITIRKNNVDINQFSDISSDSPNVDGRNHASARIVVNQPYGGPPTNFLSPLHSASSQGSLAAAPVFQTSNCRLKTKAAMKGYDNLKVSIPTYGLDLQQALERSPQGGCKLSALADIALGSEASKAAIPIDNDSDAIDVSSVENKEKPPEYMSISGTQKQKDVYDFDDTIDNMSDKVAHIQPKETRNAKIIIPERPFKNIGRDEEQTIKFQKPEVIVQQNEESLLSTLSYSDRDDFNYGSVSDKYDDEDEKQKVSSIARASSSDSSSMSSAVTAKTLENKSLIMGRIFKKAVRDEPPKRKPIDQVKSVECNDKKKDFNKLFDNLRNIDSKHNKKVMKKSTKKKATKITKKESTPTQKPLEDGQRKSQRRCAANRPKKLVEMWSSDEYEEFLSTNDVIALIEEKEREEKQKQIPVKITARRNTIVIDKAEGIKIKPKAGKSNQPTIPTTPKITSRRKTISVVNQPKLSSDPFRKPQSFSSKPTTVNKKETASLTEDTKFVIPSKISKRRKTVSQKTEEIVNNVTPKKKKTEESEMKAQQRKKRQSVDRLYYWSSSSEDEDFGRLPSPNQEEEVVSEQYQQHGWIVGGSHKKLVKLLAFAKGTKKVDDSGLKPSSNGKRK